MNVRGRRREGLRWVAVDVEGVEGVVGVEKVDAVVAEEEALEEKMDGRGIVARIRRRSERASSNGLWKRGVARLTRRGRSRGE